MGNGDECRLTARLMPSFCYASHALEYIELGATAGLSTETELAVASRQLPTVTSAPWCRSRLMLENLHEGGPLTCEFDGDENWYCLGLSPDRRAEFLVGLVEDLFAKIEEAGWVADKTYRGETCISKSSDHIRERCKAEVLHELRRAKFIEACTKEDVWAHVELEPGACDLISVIETEDENEKWILRLSYWNDEQRPEGDQLGMDHILLQWTSTPLDVLAFYNVRG